MKARDKYKKEELERMLLVEKMTYKKVGEFYGVSGVFIRKKALQLGIEVPKRIQSYNGTRERACKKEKHYCLYCNKQIFRISKKPKFCNNKCQGEHKIISSINHWLTNQQEFVGILLNHSRGYIKKYFLEKQNHLCKICGIPDEWNNKPMIFILDHVDGDASNNTEKNLRLICHNCDSQLPTYKSKNKSSARKDRYKD